MICTTLCAGHGDSVGSAYVAVETLWCRHTAVRTLRCQRVAVGTRTAQPPPSPSKVTAMAAAAPRLAGPQRACATGPPARSLPLGAPSSPLLSEPCSTAASARRAVRAARGGAGPAEGGAARGRARARRRAEPGRAAPCRASRSSGLNRRDAGPVVQRGGVGGAGGGGERQGAAGSRRRPPLAQPPRREPRPRRRRWRRRRAAAGRARRGSGSAREPQPVGGQREGEG